MVRTRDYVCARDKHVAAALLFLQRPVSKQFLVCVYVCVVFLPTWYENEVEYEGLKYR